MTREDLIELLIEAEFKGKGWNIPRRKLGNWHRTGSERAYHRSSAGKRTPQARAIKQAGKEMYLQNLDAGGFDDIADTIRTRRTRRA
jgi:hypothetical protein